MTEQPSGISSTPSAAPAIAALKGPRARRIALWLAGLFAISGTPPFGTFISEFTLLRVAFDRGHGIWAGVALLALTVAFVGLARAFLGMALGREPEGQPPRREAWAAILPPLILLAVSLGLGLWIPQGLQAALAAASHLLGGGAP